MPKIIDKSFDVLLQDNQQIANLYVPEWKPPEEDMGLALLTIFSHMREEIITRLNRVPELNLIAFLNMIGARLILPSPARVPVTFYPVEGSAREVFVPAGIQVSAPENERHGSLVYETKKSLSAVSATISEVLSIVPEEDAIYSYKDGLNNGRFELFRGINLQRHHLYLGSKDHFNVKPGTLVTLVLKMIDPGAFKPDEKLCWRCWDGTGWAPLELAEPSKIEDGKYSITFQIAREIKERKINSINSLWIACSPRSDPELGDKCDQGGLPRSIDIRFSMIGIADINSSETRDPDLIIYNYIPLDLFSGKRIYPFGRQPRIFDSFYIANKEAFSKKNANISINFIRKADDVAGEIRASKDLELSIEYWNGDIWNTLRLASPDSLEKFVGKHVLSWNKIPGDDSGKLIEFLTKEFGIDWIKNAKIEKLDNEKTVKASDGKNTLSLKLRNKDTEVVLEIDDCRRYEFNAKMENNRLSIYVGTNKSDYSGSINFTIPEDLKEAEIAGVRNYWIRIRIISGDYGKEKLPILVEDPKVLDNLDKSIEKLNGYRNDLDKLKDDPKHKEDTMLKDLVANIDSECDNLSNIKKSINIKRLTVEQDFNPPWLTEIKIAYNVGGQFHPLESCIAYNNLQYNNFTEACSLPQNNGAIEPQEGFRPFLSLDDLSPTLYIGFNDSLGNGNISIFFSVLQKLLDHDQSSGLELRWFCWSKAPDLYADMDGSKEIHLISTDGLKAGTELLFEETVGGIVLRDASIISGLIDDGSSKNVGLADVPKHRFGKSARVLKRTRLDVIDNTNKLTKSDTLEFIGPSNHQRISNFGGSYFWITGISIEKMPQDLYPTILGIFPNTVWADQVETISDEIMGSSDGEKGQQFSFARSPVISPSIWVREGTVIAENDRLIIESEGLEMVEEKDEMGKVTDIWVRWKSVPDFYESGPNSRHYMADEASGIIGFGDGVRGKIPPIGLDNVRASYQTGGGTKGNVPAGEINTIKTSISGIDRVLNHMPAEGGSDIEDLQSAIERGPHIVKCLDRAVSEEDFERLAKESSSYLARTKCFVKDSKLKIIVIPKGEEDRPMPSPGLLRVVRRHIEDRMPGSMSSEDMDITGPIYKEIRINAAVIPGSIDNAAIIEGRVVRRLKEYLHPLSGGRDGKGWYFGRNIHFSEIYELIESIEGVESIEELKINDLSRKDVENETIVIQNSEMVCSGDHVISMKGGASR